jgi:hypothetical protein
MIKVFELLQCADVLLDLFIRVLPNLSILLEVRGVERDGVEFMVAHRGDSVSVGNHVPHNIKRLAHLWPSFYEITHKCNLALVRMLVNSKLLYIIKISEQHSKGICMSMNIFAPHAGALSLVYRGNGSSNFIRSGRSEISASVSWHAWRSRIMASLSMSWPMNTSSFRRSPKCLSHLLSM